MRASGRLAAMAVAAAGIATARGAVPIPAGAPPARDGFASPIPHVVALMQENRSFDSYFGKLHFQGQPRTAAEPLRASNPNPLNEDAPPIRAFDQSAYCEVADLN